MLEVVTNAAEQVANLNVQNVENLLEKNIITGNESAWGPTLFERITLTHPNEKAKENINKIISLFLNHGKLEESTIKTSLNNFIARENAPVENIKILLENKNVQIILEKDNFEYLEKLIKFSEDRLEYIKNSGSYKVLHPDSKPSRTKSIEEALRLFNEYKTTNMV